MMAKNEQLTLLTEAWKSNEIAKKQQGIKRKWENAFQKWSNSYGNGELHTCKSWGCCGFGSMCDWCVDNTYGRPCVRALNAMCREKRLSIDYSDYDFEKVWRGEINEKSERKG